MLQLCEEDEKATAAGVARRRKMAAQPPRFTAVKLPCSSAVLRSVRGKAVCFIFVFVLQEHVTHIEYCDSIVGMSFCFCRQLGHDIIVCEVSFHRSRAIRDPEVV